ncbi:MAG: DNA-directed RNA polymerase subunit omega [Acidimicrobiales bacterium]|nr:DNA-directed RNA polymerase subunit omega [Acidimicrobiales bacterium]
MAERHDTMMNPPIEELLDRSDSKFRLVTLASTRARQINSYFNAVGSGGLGSQVPPQVPSVSRKPLSIGFEEIAAGKILPVYGEALVAKREAEAAAAAERLAAAEARDDVDEE